MRKNHKHISFDKDFLNKLEKDTTACVEIQKQLYHLALHPFHLADLNSSIKGLLDEKIAKYDKRFDGILLGYKNIKLVNNTGGINFDSCFIHIDIKADFYIFKPIVGQILNGVVNKKSKDHVGCLVHTIFNVSLPKPEDCENWIGQSAQLGQEIQFEIIFTNLDGKLPYIKGKILSLLSDDSGFSTCEEPNTIDGRQNIVKKLSESDTEIPNKPEKNVYNGENSTRLNDIELKNKKNIYECNIDEDDKPHKKHKHKEKSNKYIHEVLQVGDMNGNVDDQGNSVIIKPTKKSKKHGNEIEASTSNTIFDDDLHQVKKNKKHKHMKNTKPKKLINELNFNDNDFEERNSTEKKNSYEVLPEFKVNDNIDDQGNNVMGKSSRKLKEYGNEMKKMKKHKHMRDIKPKEAINEPDFTNNVFKEGKDVKKKNNFEVLQENKNSASTNDQEDNAITKALRNSKEHEMQASISNVIIDDEFVQIKRKKKHKMNKVKLDFQDEPFKELKKSSKHKHSIQTTAMDISVNNLPLNNDSKISKRKKSKNLSFDNDVCAQQSEYYDCTREVASDSEDKLRIHVKKRKKEK